LYLLGQTAFFTDNRFKPTERLKSILDGICEKAPYIAPSVKIGQQILRIVRGILIPDLTVSMFRTKLAHFFIIRDNHENFLLSCWRAGGQIINGLLEGHK